MHGSGARSIMAEELAEIRQVVENLGARVITLEALVAQQRTEINAAGAKFVGLDAEINQMKGRLEIKTEKGMKEILESKAIQNLGKLANAKEYRYWNQRLKNAMDQARPRYGRRLMTWLEGISEKEVEEAGETSSSDDHNEWVMEIIMGKVRDEDKITEEDIRSGNRDIWAVLVDKCEGEAIHKVNSAEQGKGLWAYIRVHQWFNKTTELGKMSRVIDIMRPEPCKHEHEIAGAIEKWERNYRRIIEKIRRNHYPTDTG